MTCSLRFPPPNLLHEVLNFLFPFVSGGRIWQRKEGVPSRKKTALNRASEPAGSGGEAAETAGKTAGPRKRDFREVRAVCHSHPRPVGEEAGPPLGSQVRAEL